LILKGKNMRRFLLGLIALGLMATAVAGICSEKEDTATPETTTVLKESIIKEGSTLISQGNYDQVLAAIADLPPEERNDVHIKTIECFANLKCWVNERKQTCKTNGFTQRHNLILVGDSEATPLLLVFLNDTDDWIRKYAAELLGHIGDKRALEDLRDAADNDENHRVRRYAEWAYKMISEKESEIQQ
jgi:hypothetical protein